MRSSFSGYYSPTPEEYQRLWSDGLIVLDTNVLLDLYRLPTSARDELLGALFLFKERLWIPHQVALEFQRRRLSVIAGERKNSGETLSSASKLVDELSRKVDCLQINKRGLGIKVEPLIEELRAANAKLIEAIKAVQNEQVDVDQTDVVRDKLDELFASSVGPGPNTQVELESLIAGGEERFRDGIPPGFADADKEKNPNEATFVHDHLRYPRKFGDLILWRQLTRHVKEAKIKVVLLVTGDKKEDWWWREQGKTIGPHPELIREIKRDGEAELFWMYNSVQFVEHAPRYTTAQLSSQSLEELKEVVSLPAVLPEQAPRAFIKDIPRRSAEYPEVHRLDPIDAEMAVARWLTNTGRNVVAQDGDFPDFIIRSTAGLHGYDVKIARRFDQLLFPPSVVTALLRGYLELKEGRLSQFTLTVVISQQDFDSIVETHGELLRSRLIRLLRKYPVTSIVVGSAFDGIFVPLVEVELEDVDEGDDI